MVSCPYLPLPERRLTAEDIHALGADRSELFYATAMAYAQSLWLEGYPAKSLLLVNRALSCHLPGISFLPPTGCTPPEGIAAPYHAKAWILMHRPEGKFVGNPRRHYQHLATRMVGPHQELRTWRAWACWYLAKEQLPEKEFPSDTLQVRHEGVIEPTHADIAGHLARLSPGDDLLAWEDALATLRRWMGKASVSIPDPPVFRLISTDEVETVRRLAHEIWHACYPEIISVEQIRYMLQRMYDADELRQEMAVRGVKYALVESDGAPCGYLAWEFVPNDRSLFLHKLYVDPHLHSRGLGAASIRWLEQEARKEAATCIRLRVNRNNHRAIRSYLRAGFTFAHDLTTDIGGGFIMDDHVMVKGVKSEKG